MITDESELLHEMDKSHDNSWLFQSEQNCDHYNTESTDLKEG